MKRSIVVAAVVFLFAIAPSWAQLMKTSMGAGVGRGLTDHMLIKLSDQYLKGLPEEEVEGTPYLTDEFAKANVYTRKGVFDSIEMRFNIYGDYFEFKEKEQLYALDPRRDIMKVVFENMVFVVDNHPEKGRMVPGYFQRLDSGKISLLVKPGMMYQESRPPGALDSAPKPAKFTRTNDDYFLKMEGKDPEKIGNLKSLIYILPDHKEEMEKYAKREKISTKDAEDLKKFLQHYNSL